MTLTEGRSRSPSSIRREFEDFDTDIIVYGGATFVASLIDHDLLDELNLFVNPVAIAEGLRVFTARTPRRK
jgi:dihydrofolate reductase